MPLAKFRHLRRLIFGLRSRATERPAAPLADMMTPAQAATHAKLATNAEILGIGYGQLRTFDTHRPVDNLGNALPWFTYPAIEYLKRFECREWRIFEYGAGQSTAYWSGRGATVSSVEHNEQWFTEIEKQQLANSRIVHRTDPQSYAGAIRQGDTKYNVIVIDGVWREVCAEVCVEFLCDDGFLILDNSDWYHEAAAKIRKRGFLEVSFSGFGPVNDYTWTTSLFFKGPTGIQRDLAPPDPIGGLRHTRSVDDVLW
jgi:hypothetical protein